MVYDYRKLSGKITEVFGSQVKFASELDVAERTLSEKMTNKSDWKQSEIIKACDLLHIAHDEIPVYFFRLEAQS